MAIEWISIKTKKPGLSERVLLFVDKDYFPKQIGFRMPNNKFMIESWQKEREDVTYWMPLKNEERKTVHYYNDHALFLEEKEWG